MSEEKFEEMPEVGTEEETLIYKGALKDFSTIPNIFFRCGKGITSHALRLWGTLVMHAMGKGHCWPGAECLIEEMGMSRNIIFKSLRELEEKHLIKRIRRGLTDTNRYEIYDPVKKYLYRPIENSKILKKSPDTFSKRYGLPSNNAKNENPQAVVYTPIRQEV